MLVADMVVGALLLAFGRKLFWFFVAAIGFAFGLYIAGRIFDIRPEWLVWVIGIVLGIIGAVAAIVIERIAIGTAGFLAGAYIAASIATAFGLQRADVLTLIGIVGGVIGAILIALILDWALIFLSSLMGASLVIDGLHWATPMAWIGVLVLCVIGILIQTSLKRAEKQGPAPQRPQQSGV